MADSSDRASREMAQALEFLETRYEDVAAAPWPWLVDSDQSDPDEQFYLVDPDARRRLMLCLDADRLQRWALRRRAHDLVIRRLDNDASPIAYEP